MSVHISFHGSHIRAEAVSSQGSSWLTLTTIDTMWGGKDEITFFLRVDFDKMKSLADMINAAFPEPGATPDDPQPVNAVIGENAIDHDNLDF